MDVVIIVAIIVVVVVIDVVGKLMSSLIAYKLLEEIVLRHRARNN